MPRQESMVHAFARWPSLVGVQSEITCLSNALLLPVVLTAWLVLEFDQNLEDTVSD
jgi:hypothetical protein